MAKSITQRALRHQSGEITRALDRGESFVVTRRGVPVGDLTPVRPRRAVDREAVLNAFAGAPPIDAARFLADVDAVIAQDPAPRG